MTFIKTCTTIFASVAALMAPLCSIANASAAETAALAALPMVILVRHAEKADDKAADPVLSAAGIARAEALAVALKDAGVTAIITTTLQRTILTAKPIAAAHGIMPQTIPIQRDGLKLHIDAVTAAIRGHRAQKNAVVLVVGHSNTVPLIVNALGGPPLPILCEADYSSLFVVTPASSGGVRVVRSQFGAASKTDVMEHEGCQ
ncbi:MAG: phosphoglycerate mutase family protein [Pseudomonadota bacterium]